ncbi:7 transmembrane receptor (rhodopsin family) domain-containing protein [Phthorimaea operculella]|nr:7 transmembrane receptor (rhodopsin family) domain-containing protein [Phthorimaea operculella]
MGEALTNSHYCTTPECLQNVYYNDSYHNYTWTQLACVLESSPEDLLSSPIFQACVYLMYIAIFIVALVGNGMVCYVVYSFPRMKTVTNYFIVNLAVGDILMTVFCVPFTFVSTLALRYWPFGAVMCKIVNYSQAVSVLVSAYTLLAISIDRYIVIMRPLQPRLGKAHARLVVLAVWIGALATAAPIPIVSQLQKPSPWHEACNVDLCGERWPSMQQSEQYTCALLVLQFALPLGALVCTYARIAHVVWGGRCPGEAQSARDSRLQSSKRKGRQMMISEQYTCVLLVIQFALPLGALVCTYARIAHVVWGGRCPGEAQSARDSRLQSSKRKFALPLGALVCTYARIAHVVWGGRCPGEAQSARDSRLQSSKRKFALPLGALVCTYARIAHVVWGGRCPGEAQSARDSRLQSSKRKMVKMMVTVVAVFTICWLPLNVFIVLWTAHEGDEEWSTWPGMPYVWFASHWLAMSHCCYNPIIYGYMNARYRRGFQKILSCMFCLKFPESNNSTHRLSICEGVPLSEMVNGSTIPRRVTACKCRKIRGFSATSIGTCTNCVSIKQIRFQPHSPLPSIASEAPARALSVRSNFTY